ncbi:IclR family transcriptional regulator [Paenirhodobacter enshiensis]|uniref:IclR family transcriptional regulator n=1 Tax=Paenirhodobacter enshiensis TaxID=1105367 RepID=A0A086XXT5_9RHOB|nr:IclR family transcriptional regulator [Paenirhodobacter enshiensis]KFI26835.1 IclR family transcriptional regulator [Paenirhodobacter enshiensis]
MRPRKSLDSEEGPNSAFVSALARGLDILGAFRRGESSLGNKDLAERTGLSKSTVSRLTYTLQRTGHLSYDPLTSRYSLAPPVLSLGFSCLSGMSVLALARPKIEALANEIGAPVAIAGRDRTSMVYLECAKGSNAVILAIEVGVHIKLATSALGRAYIAAQSERQREEIFAALADHEAERWPEIRQGIDTEIARYRELGYCLSLRDWKPDVNSVAVPYIPGDGGPVLAFNCGGPSQILTEERIRDEVGPKLIALVRDLNRITR